MQARPKRIHKGVNEVKFYLKEMEANKLTPIIYNGDELWFFSGSKCSVIPMKRDRQPPFSSVQYGSLDEYIKEIQKHPDTEELVNAILRKVI